MHLITVTRKTTAEPQAIWELWADAPNRTRWDQSLEYATLEGPFRSGATGTVKLKGQPERKFQVLRCEPPQAYTDRFFLPMGGKMDWSHTIREVDHERQVTFDVSVIGPTSPLLGLVLRRILRRELPPTVERLICLAEQTRAA
jgi:polyketide cyclase/dehydrase/lipid transport protein